MFYLYENKNLERKGNGLLARIMKNILLVDDEPMFFDLLNLQSPAISTYCFHYLQDPKLVFDVVDAKAIDLILMDWKLAGESGLEYVKLIRAHPSCCNIPIIMLTVRGEKNCIIEALTQGANDHVVKPFDFEILTARIHAQLAKHGSNTRIRLYCETYEVAFDNKKIKFRRKEFIIFKTLLENPDRTFLRKDLNDLTSGEDVFVSGRSIDTFIRFLRKKLPSPDLIETVRGKGYRIKLP
jgi:DNA-binding response OmpR family regulator